MTKLPADPFGARSQLGEHIIFRLDALAKRGLGSGQHLPFSIRVLLEGLLRNCDGYLVQAADVERLAAWNAAQPAANELPFMPARVIMQDCTLMPVAGFSLAAG